MKAACKAILALPDAEGMSCYAGQFDKNEALTVNFSEASPSSAGGSLTSTASPRSTRPWPRRA